MENQTHIMPIGHNQLDEIVAVHLASREPMFLWGSPGGGKSAHLESAVTKCGYVYNDMRMAEKDTADVRGVPKPVQVTVGEFTEWVTQWARPSDLPSHDCPPTVINLDELQQAHQSVGVLAGRLVNERKIGDYTLNDNVVVFGASNLHTDRAGANRMLSHTANRFMHYELMIDAHQWTGDYAVSADIDPRVIGFIRFRPELVYKFDPKDASPAFPSLRMWEKLSNVLKHVENNNLVLLNAVSCGAVGMAVGSEFVGFCRGLDRLPDIQAIIADPDAHDDPVEPDLRYAVGSALARFSDEDNIENIWQYMGKLPAEYQVLFAKDVVANTSNSGFDLTQHSVYTEIINLHQDMLTQ